MKPTAYAILQSAAMTAALSWRDYARNANGLEELNESYGTFLDKLVRDHEVLFGIPLIDAMGNPIVAAEDQ